MSTSLLLQLIAISHATLINPGDGSVRKDVTVVIRGTRIEQVVPATSAQVPTGARLIDAKGKFLIPGLWDMHVHTDVPGGASLLSLFVVNGVTGVRDMDGDLARLRGYQRDIAAGRLIGPRMVVSGPYLAGQRVPVPSLVVRTPEEAVAAVDSLQRLGVDFVKVHNGMPPQAYFAAAREARRLGLVFAGHVFPPVTPLQASDSGQRSLEHLSGFPNPCTSDDSSTIAHAHPVQRFLLGGCTTADQHQAFAQIAKNGTWVTPTLVVQMEVVHPGMTPPPNDSLRHYFSDSLQALWNLMLPSLGPATKELVDGGALLFAKRMQLVRELHASGVPILVGTDAPLRPSPPGFGLHDELSLLVRSGLTPLEALRGATFEPARYLAATDSLGSIEPGKVADLVLLDGDPLADISNTRRIFAVVANGRLFMRQERAQALVAAQRAAHPGPAH